MQLARRPAVVAESRSRIGERVRSKHVGRWERCVGVVVSVTLLSACAPGLGRLVPGLGAPLPVQPVPGGSPQRGALELRQYGCGACHAIPGVPGARGAVGPPLAGFAGRAIVAGSLPNTPENLVRWIRDPQGIAPGTAMPNLGVSVADARDIAAYLYTLR
jgi:cytochrome c2